MNQYQDADDIELADADALVTEIREAMNAVARRYSDLDKFAEGVIARSMSRKHAPRITTGEAKKLADFGMSVYEQIADSFWSDY